MSQFLSHAVAGEELAKRAADASDFRKSADDLFERVVDEIQKLEGCGRRVAYHLAAFDERGRTMYALSQAKQDEEAAIRAVIGR